MSASRFFRRLAFAVVVVWVIVECMRMSTAATFTVKYRNNQLQAQEITVQELIGTGDCCEGYYPPNPPETFIVSPGVEVTRVYSVPIGAEGDPALWRLIISRQDYADAVLVGNSYVGGSTPTLTQIGDYVLPIVVTSPQNEIFNLPVGRMLNPDGSKTIWKLSDTELTADLFREGVDKIIAFQNKTPGSTEGGGAGSMPNTELTHTAAKDANLLTDFTDLTPSASKAVMESSGAAAGAEVSGILGTVPTGLGYSLSPGGEPNLTVAMPSRFGGATFDLNPFQSDRLLGVTSWFRAAMAWLTLVTLGVWVWSEMAEWMRGFSTIRQAHGNPVMLGTGSQATALAAAGLITTAIVVAITALVGWSFGDLNVPAMVAAVTTNPVVTIPAGVLWMLDQVFPVATMIAALVARLTFNMYGSIVFGVASSVIRFIVP